MLLIIHTHSPQQARKEFSCFFDDLEKVYDFLLAVKQGGDEVLGAKVIEGQVHYWLGVEAINLGLTANPFQQLRRQWEQALPLLTTPPVFTVDCFQERRLAAQQTYLANLEETLYQSLSLLERAQLRLREGPQKTSLLRHYWLTIARCHTSLGRIRSMEAMP